MMKARSPLWWTLHVVAIGLGLIQVLDLIGVIHVGAGPPAGASSSYKAGYRVGSLFWPCVDAFAAYRLWRELQREPAAQQPKTYGLPHSGPQQQWAQYAQQPQQAPGQGYPQQAYPAQQAYPQAGYPPQQVYPQAGYPQQQAYPQAGYPPQQAYPPAGYPPQPPAAPPAPDASGSVPPPGLPG